MASTRMPPTLWSRRGFLSAVAAGCAARSLASDALFRPIEINHIALRVKDLKASEAFYRSRFRAPGIIFERPNQRYLRMGVNFVALFESGEAAMDHFAISIEDYDPDAVEKALREAGHDVRRSDAFVYVHDPDGIEVQIAHAEHEMASPVVREAPETSTFQGSGINHVALRVRDVARSRAFYQKVFGLPLRSGGSTSTFLGLNDDFLALFRGDEPGMDHFCISIDDFDPSRAVAALEKEGESPRRFGNRVYFDDPNGLRVQVAAGAHQP